MQTYQETQTIPVRDEYDVIVAGGGVAGVAAAISAARAGKRVLILEKSMQLGGLATLGLINFFVPMCNGRGRQIIFGLAEEFLRRSIAYGYDTLPKDWCDGTQSPQSRYMTRFSAEIFALTLTELVTQNAIDVLFDTAFCAPAMTGRHVDGLIVENKSGRALYPAKMIVDATGDADVLFRAGVPTLSRGNFHTYMGVKITMDSLREALSSGRIERALQSVTGGNATLYGNNHPAGMPLYDGTDGAAVSRYVIRNQLEMLSSIKADDRFSRDIVMLPGMAQFRTTRCICGGYTLKTDDAYRHFADSVCAINDFDRRDFLYEVPYRTLVNADFDNLITAGRSASAEGYAWDVLRVIPPAILTGQAAGHAAAQALEERTPIAQIDVSRLQKTLAQENVQIHFEDSWIPAAPSSAMPERNEG